MPGTCLLLLLANKCLSAKQELAANSTLATPTFRVLNQMRRKCCLCYNIRKQLVGVFPWEIFWILTPQVPFPGFLTHSDRIFTNCPNHFSDFNLQSLKFFTKNIFIMKNLTNLYKIVETGMDLNLVRLSSVLNFAG